MYTLAISAKSVPYIMSDVQCMFSTDPKMLLSVSKIFRYDGHKRGGGTKSSRGRQKLKYKVKKEQKVSHDKRIHGTVIVSLNERSSASLSQLCCRVSTI